MVAASVTAIPASIEFPLMTLKSVSLLVLEGEAVPPADATTDGPFTYCSPSDIAFPARRIKVENSSAASAATPMSTETSFDTPDGTTKLELTVEAIRLSIAVNVPATVVNAVSDLAMVRAICISPFLDSEVKFRSTNLSGG